MSRIDRTNLADDVYTELRARLMDGEIAPDSRLKIEVLAEGLGVSATPVREALARLEADDLVRKEPRRGYLSTPLLTREELMDLFDFRELIEPHAAGRAAARVDASAMERLRQEMQEGRSARTGDSFADYQASLLHDQRLHQDIADLSGSAALASAYARTHVHLHVFRLQLRFHHEVWQRTLREHAEIVERICDGDVAGAQAAMSTHLLSSRRHADNTLEELSTSTGRRASSTLAG